MQVSSQPSNPDDVRQLAKQYMRRTGMAPADFARRVGYHYNTFLQFLTNKYRRGAASKEHFISEAILRFIGTSHADSDDAFTGTLYDIGNVRAMREIFTLLCDRSCIVLGYAPPGSGKTDVAKALMPQFAATGVPLFRIYCRQGISRRDLMRRIAVQCGSVGDLSIERTIANLRYDFAGKRVALYFDEAQHLSVACLETIRELYDEMHWSLCLAGSHQLDRIFTKWIGDLEQLERRVAAKIFIPAATADEAAHIIQSELPGLSPAKVRVLIDTSHVEIRGEGGMQRHLSIGRIMTNIRDLQRVMPEAVDPHPVAVESLSEEIA